METEEHCGLFGTKSDRHQWNARDQHNQGRERNDETTRSMNMESEHLQIEHHALDRKSVV